MKDKIFIDTNILIYLYSEDEIEKQQISENLANHYSAIISKVLNEISNVLIKKLNFDLKTVSKVIGEISQYCIVKTITTETVQSAIKIVEKYKYSYYESLIISSAIENQCNRL